MGGWTNPRILIKEEIHVMRDQGAVIPRGLSEAIDRLHPEADRWNVARIDPLYDALVSLPVDQALAAEEPNDLAGIRRLRPAGPRDLAWQPGDAEAFDRFHGAWTGRAAGCALGKPVEGMGLSSEGTAIAGRRRIRAHLMATGAWPLADYILPGEGVGCPQSQRGTIAYMEPDDDIHYTLAGLGVLEEHGPGFAWEDVARWWAAHIPFTFLCTAECQAMLNFLTRANAGGYLPSSSATPAFTRFHRNPYREWIGAQIRCDGYAMACAGRPELAAELAWRDAHWTHERNGIYGAMFCAAMQAAAFAVDDPRTLVEIGLSEIPACCRLALAVRRTLAEILPGRDADAVMDRVEAICREYQPAFGVDTIKHDMHPVHVINNACVCVAAMVLGGLDSLRTPATAVMCGMDTDCNGATVGTIAGAVSGRRRFAPVLADPLHDTIRPALVGWSDLRMADLAQRTMAQWRRIDAWLSASRRP